MGILREWGKRDLYFLAKYILGYWWLTSPVHWDFCTEILQDIPLSLYLLPRGHCKTILFTIADSVRQYLLAPSDPIALVCDTLNRSKKKLRAVRWHFEHNQVFRSIYPTWDNPQKESPKWTDEEFILPGHDGRQESSVMATSLENQPTGLHFPRVKCDDLVTPEGVTTREQMDKVRQYYGLFRSSILQAGGNLQIVGTIYDDGDLHREMERSGIYRTYKRPAIDPETKTALWPEQYGLEDLDKIRRDPTVRDYIFSCQYLLDPAPEDENSFYQLRWFRRYRVLPERLQLYAAADLAISEKESAAYTAILVGGVDHWNRLHIVHVRRGHWGAFDIVGNLIEVQERFRPIIFAIEAENIARTIGPFLNQKMLETGVFLNQELITPTTDKVARARSIQGRVKEGAVVLPEQGDNQPGWLADFEAEIRRFPRARTKDQADSFSLMGLLLDQQRRPKFLEEEWRERQIDQPAVLDPEAGF